METSLKRTETSKRRLKLGSVSCAKVTRKCLVLRWFSKVRYANSGLTPIK